MKFEENKIAKTIELYENVFVYFLLKNNEVVYVGQTKKGTSRINAHTNKDFDKVKVIYCKIGELDKLEDFYIKKYNPKYNKQLNFAMNYSLKRAKSHIKEFFDDDTFNLYDLKKLIKKLDIKLILRDCAPYIEYNDLQKIIDYIAEERQKNEMDN